MGSRRVSVNAVVLVIAVILIGLCAAWAMAVDRIVPDFCTAGRPADINHAGPVTCPPNLQTLTPTSIP